MAQSGYAVLERPSRDVTRPEQERTFEVLDTKTLSKEILQVGGRTKSGRKKKDRKMVANPPILPITIPTDVEAEEDSLEPTQEAPRHLQEDEEEQLPVLPTERQNIKVFTDITEATIEVVYHYHDESVVCLFMDQGSRTKLRPKKGMVLEIEIDGERINVYSPGVYVPIEPFGVDLVFLLVNSSPEE
jgi:hypothetical protein